MWFWDKRIDEKEKTEIDQIDNAESEAEQKAMIASGLKFRRRLLIVIVVCILLCICSV